MIYKAKRMTIKNFRKLHELESITFGNKISVISGINGLGKSNILSIISSLFGVSNNRYTGGNFQPEFNEYFNISEDENFQSYEVFIEVSTDTDDTISKRMDFSDYTESGRGIRIIPRTTNYFYSDPKPTLTSINLKNKEKLFKVGPDSRVRIPCVFVSLSRLFPIGETKTTETKISKNNKLIKHNIYKKYIEWYNAVLPSSINTDETNITITSKEVGENNRKNIYISIGDSRYNTQSIGQDNLGNIISALVDIYIYREDNIHTYEGAVLCIDEIDSSLHPSAQIRLFGLLDKLSTELSLQIFVSSHGLPILEEITRKTAIDPKNYQLIYLKGGINPYNTAINDFDTLKSNLYDEINNIEPNIKIYCEDPETERLFQLLIKTANALGVSKKFPTYSIIPIRLGAEQLLNASKNDPYFESVGIILDGDARSKNKKLTIEEYLENPDIISGLTTRNMNKNRNVVFLPNFLPPESYLYSVISDYTIHESDNFGFWRGLDRNSRTFHYTTDYITNNIINLQPLTNDNFKKKDISDTMFKFCEESSILIDYYSKEENKTELKKFIDDFSKILEVVKKKLKSSRF